MATRSAAKAWRRSEQRRLRNRARRSTAKTFVRKAEAAIAAANVEESAETVRLAIGALDRAAQKGALHLNNAARRKARLMRKYGTLLAAAAAQKEAAPAPRRRVRAKEAAPEKPPKKPGRSSKKEK